MKLEAGDIAACYGTCRVSRMIRYGTASLFGPRRLRVGPSHVAILVEHRQLGLVWVESTTLSPLPCLIKRHHVSGMQAHDPDDAIATYAEAGGWVDIYRPAPLYRFTLDEELFLSSIVTNLIKEDVKYDTAGAALAGTKVFKLSRLFPGADLEKIFCSELVAAILQRLNRMNKRNPAKYHPAGLLRQLVSQGTYRFQERAERTPIRVFQPPPEERAA